MCWMFLQRSTRPWRRIIHQKSAPEIRWISLWWTRVFGWFGHHNKRKLDLGMWIYINWNPQEGSIQRLKIIQTLCSGHTSNVKHLENRRTSTAASIIMITVHYLATPLCLILILPIVQLLHVYFKSNGWSKSGEPILLRLLPLYFCREVLFILG